MKRYTAKPGAEKRPFRPDVILTFSPAEDTPLLEYLFQAMPDRKRTNVKELLKYGQVMVGGEVQRQFDLPVEAGTEVKVNLTRPFVTFYDRRLKLVYEDDDIIVVNKGYGLLSMGNDKIKEGTAYSILRQYLKTKDPRNKLFIVHRLDQHTSGLMMFAKNTQAKETMQHNWNNMVLERCYNAIIRGRMEPAEGEIRSYLTENSAHEVYSTQNPEEGQLAVTRYRTVGHRGPYTLLELNLATGRKNQIRVHLKDSGHPIVGDRRYGSDESPIHRLALHARTLRFVHPVTRRDMNFSCPLPASFSKLV